MSSDKKQNNYDVPYNNFDKPPVEIVDSSNRKKKKTIILIAVAVGVVILCVLLGTLFAKLGKADADKKTTRTSVSDIYDYSSETESIDSSSINIVPTPDCLGKTKEEVVGILDSLGITYDIISSPSSDDEKNKVITQSIEAGEEIPEGAVLTIVIGEGTETNSSSIIEQNNNQASPVIPISSVTINLSKTVLYPGETVKIKGTYSPSTATETEYYYTVDNYSIAYIDENNNLCAINPGTTNIRAMDLEGNSLGHCSITIKAKETTTKKVTTTQKPTTTAKPVCTVTFDANGGSVSTNSRKVNIGENIGTLPVATRTGYTFDGWYTHPSGGSQITEYSSVSSSNQTLYAHWTPITYELRFDANGGTGAPATQKGSSSYTISSTQPSRSGYTFLGWSKNSSASSASYHAGDSISLSSNTTLYAVWKKITYTLTYSANGGTGAPSTQNGDTSYTISYTEPTRTGYVFAGWSKSNSATSPSYYGGNSITLSSNTTLYAVWEKPEIILSSYSGSGRQAASSTNLYTLDSWSNGIEYNTGTYKGFRVPLPSVVSHNIPGWNAVGWEVYSGNCVCTTDYIYISQPGTVKVRYRIGNYYSDVYTYTLSLYKATTDINYIRSQPSGSGTRVGTVPANTTVEITSLNWNGTYTKNGTTYPAVWGYVNYNGKSGYIILWYSH